MKTFFSWIGNADLRAIGGASERGAGPLHDACVGLAPLHCVHLLDDQGRGEAYREWLCSRVDIEPGRVIVHPVRGRPRFVPTDFAQVYRACVAVLDKHPLAPGEQRNYHASGGTPTMATVWTLLSVNPRYAGKLVESSIEHGVKSISVPFDIAYEFRADILPAPSSTEDIIARLPDSPALRTIVMESRAMREAAALAYKAARTAFPVLLTGETGTGKELIAQAIHEWSGRTGPLIPVNCGALPRETIESELFGYAPGAFTGGLRGGKAAIFEAAGTGTVFLDEIGELPLDQQVKLLRVLQSRSVRRVGANTEIPLHCRVVAATHRNLMRAVADGTFREDLYYRLAIVTIELPPLREQRGAIGTLIGRILENVVAENPQLTGQSLSPSALRALLDHDWPGNVRELDATLKRACLISEDSTIDADTMRTAIGKNSNSDGSSSHEIGPGFSLETRLSELTRGFLEQALAQSGSKKAAAASLGFHNPTTFDNWLKRYGVLGRTKR